MKRLNLILISAEPDTLIPGTSYEIKGSDIKPEDITPELLQQIDMMNQQLTMNPEFANDPEVKKLMELSKEMMEAYPEKFGMKAEVVEDGKTDDKGKPADKGNTEKTGLENLPFFGEGVEKPEVKGVTLDKLPEFAKDKLKIDTSKPDWVEQLLGGLINNDTASFAEIKSKYEALEADIQGLPKDLQLALEDVATGKDWKARFKAAQSLDFEKEFKDMTTAEKIAVHNFFFPEDKLEADADIKEKTNMKSIVAAESKFKAEQQIYTQSIQADKDRQKQNTVAWNASVDASLNALKIKYPSFKAQELLKIETTIKKTGLWDMFVNKDGTLKPEAAQRLAFAIYGEDILNTAVAVAKNKGKSEGKEEVIKGGQSRGAGRSVDENMTDEERKHMKLLKDAEASVGVGNNPY